MHAQDASSLATAPDPLRPLGSRMETPRSTGPSSHRGSGQGRRRASGDPRSPLPSPHQLQTHLRFIFLCCLLCGGQASRPTLSWTGQRSPRHRSQPSPEQPPACRPLSRPRARQALSSGLAGHSSQSPRACLPIVCRVYKPGRVCFTILLRVTPRSGRGLHAILLRPRSARAWALHPSSP